MTAQNTQEKLHSAERLELRDLLAWLHSEDIKERLNLTLQRKFLEMWNENPPPITSEGTYDTEQLAKLSQRWIDYIGNLGGCVLTWTDAYRLEGTGQHGRGVILRSETPWGSNFKHILIPDEVATKILVLGDLP